VRRFRTATASHAQEFLSLRLRFSPHAQAFEIASDLRQQVCGLRSESVRSSLDQHGAVSILTAKIVLLGSFQAAISRWHAPRTPLASPSHTPDGLQIQGTAFVETYYRAMRRAASIERPDAFFLRSNAGSFEVFQVRTRWAVSPSRRNSRRTHSSVTGGSSFRRRQYSASLETDHTENGNPRSEGFDKATSTSSRSCAARRMGGRPFGLGTCSKVPNPVSLKRWTQSYATVKWQPTRSAASSRLKPRRTWSMT